MRRTTVPALSLAVLASLLLALVGCGGSKKASTTTTTAASAPATTTAATTTEAAGTTTKTESSSVPSLASAANCKQLADLGAQYSKAITGAANGQDMKKTGQLLQEFAAKTPADIRPDFEVVAQAYAKLAGALGDLKPGVASNAAALAKLQKLVAGLDTAKLTQATQHISKWVKQNCHA
jgi:hypothetical protein